MRVEDRTFDERTLFESGMQRHVTQVQVVLFVVVLGILLLVVMYLLFKTFHHMGTL